MGQNTSVKLLLVPSNLFMIPIHKIKRTLHSPWETCCLLRFVIVVPPQQLHLKYDNNPAIIVCCLCGKYIRDSLLTYSVPTICISQRIIMYTTAMGWVHYHSVYPSNCCSYNLVEIMCYADPFNAHIYIGLASKLIHTRDFILFDTAGKKFIRPILCCLYLWQNIIWNDATIIIGMSYLWYCKYV